MVAEADQLGRKRLDKLLYPASFFSFADLTYFFFKLFGKYPNLVIIVTGFCKRNIHCNDVLLPYHDDSVAISTITSLYLKYIHNADH